MWAAAGGQAEEEAALWRWEAVAGTGEREPEDWTREEAIFFVGRGQRHLSGRGGFHRARLEVVSERRQ